MIFVFRADSSSEIGTGHIMRCLTLAKALTKRGMSCRFVCRDLPGNLNSFIREQGFEVIVLPVTVIADSDAKSKLPEVVGSAEWTWHVDGTLTGEYLKLARVDWLVVDHYDLDYRWESSLKSCCKKILVIDDLANRKHQCDLLLDQNLYLDMNHRYQDLVPNGSSTLLGPHFALLQDQYTSLHGRIPPRRGVPSRILIYFGGSREGEVWSTKALSFITKHVTLDMKFDVVVSRESDRYRDYFELKSSDSRIQLHNSGPSLAPLMVQADLAIGAAGATSWERCCLGLPSIVVSLAENQRPIAENLANFGAVNWLGHFDSLSDAEFESKMVAILKSDLDSSWSMRCMDLVDGRGVERVVDRLLCQSDETLSCRGAGYRDEPLVLGWNLKQINSYSSKGLNDGQLAEQNYIKMLRDFDNFKAYVVEINSSCPVGMVVFRREAGVWITSAIWADSSSDRSHERGMLAAAISALRTEEMGSITFSSLCDIDKNASDSGLNITLCSGKNNWVNEHLPSLIEDWLTDGHRISWVHRLDEITHGDFCIFLGYEQIVGAEIRKRFLHSLVVHASDLPKGRGWSPASWRILEGENEIAVSLIEAEDKVDAGVIYDQERISLNGNELIDEWRVKLGESTLRLLKKFVQTFSENEVLGKAQVGEPSYYPRRKAKDSEIDPRLPLVDQFNKLRIVDNVSYPAFFYHLGRRYNLKIDA